MCCVVKNKKGFLSRLSCDAAVGVSIAQKWQDGKLVFRDDIIQSQGVHSSHSLHNRRHKSLLLTQFIIIVSISLCLVSSMSRDCDGR